MAAAGPPGRGWYADPRGSAGVRWWDGAEWAYAVDKRPPGRRLPGWAKTCLAIGIAVCVANLAFLTLGLLLAMLSEGDARTFDRILDLWACAALSLAIASLAAAARGGTRVRLSALIVAIAVSAGSWTWYRTSLPPKPTPTLAELKQSPAAQLIYPGAIVATQLTRGRDSYWAGASPVPALVSRDEATNDSWPQVLAWFDQRLTADGWTRNTAATTSSIGTIALTWAWTKGNDSFTLSAYSEAGRDALYTQAPELRGRTMALDTDLR
jgi:hypothetical protein